MEPQEEQIAPEIIQAIIDQATASGLSVNDYLAKLLGLTYGHVEENGSQLVTPFELAGDLVGAFDSSVPDPDPDAQPRHTAFGAHLLQEYRKQVEKLS
ncbi:MAG: hypothetical protein MOB07_26725 [Acidobacteria bacterium]|nr:hypothetical protein [Acidobacteriota bacterium]